jgi:hypothetical protein
METLDDSPPRRSRAQLQAWVEEFEREQHCIAGSISVAPQEDAATEDTGLVILRLRNVAASVLVKPRGYDDPHWELVVTEQSDDLTMSVHDLASLAAEYVVASNLCAFLQWKSLEWDRETGQRSD